jgi:membrane associated rhomboid family serine protease
MAYRGNYNTFGGFHLTPWVKRLLIANTAVFLLTMVLPRGLQMWVVENFSFQPRNVLTQPWGMVTYMFLHGDFWHLLVNMLALFFFGAPLEERWGSREFLKYYLICGLGGALFSFIFAFNSSVLGASGAVFGVMLAFAMNWPDALIYFFGIFPIKAKWLVGIFVAFNLLSAFLSVRNGVSDGVAYFAHLGGFAVGWLYMKMDFRTSAFFGRFKRLINRPRLTVVSGSPQQDHKPGSRRRVDERVYDDVDKVLDKISTQGIASLTPEERQLLDEVSKRYRQN